MDHDGTFAWSERSPKSEMAHGRAPSHIFNQKQLTAPGVRPPRFQTFRSEDAVCDEDHVFLMLDHFRRLEDSAHCLPRKSQRLGVLCWSTSLKFWHSPAFPISTCIFFEPMSRAAATLETLPQLELYRAS